MSFEVATLKQRPDLEEQVDRLAQEAWPTFLLHGVITHWESLFDDFAEYQSLPDTQGATHPLRFRATVGGEVEVTLT